MSFYYPWMWWLALTLPAILALYILRPRRRQISVPSTLLWLPVAAGLEASRPWQRLRPGLLLLLQLLAALLLAVAAAGPVWHTGTSSRSTIVLLDTSASMGASAGQDSRLELAGEKVISLAAGLNRGASLTVITFDRRPRVVIKDAVGPEEVSRALETVRPSAYAARPDEAVSLARALAGNYSSPRLVLVSDGGINLPGNNRDIEFIPVGDGDASVAIAALDLRPTGFEQAAQVTVVNNGSRPASGTIALRTGNYPAGAREWHLGPGEVDHILWKELPGDVSVEAQLKLKEPAMDLLALDNRAWAVPGETTEQKILLVSGGNIFLEKVLGLLPGATVYVTDAARYRILRQGEYPYDITVLDGIAGPLPPGPTLLVDPPPGPVTSGLAVGAETGGATLNPVPGSPVAKHADMTGVTVTGARVLKTGAGWSVDMRSGEKPVFARARTGERRLAVWSLDLHRSDLPLRPAFPVLVQNTLEWLAPPGLGLPGQVSTGEELVLRVPGSTTEISVENDRGMSVQFAPPFPPNSWVARAPGLYRFLVYRPGGTMVREVAVNGYHPSEADLRVRRPGVADAESESPELQARAETGRALNLVRWLAGAALLVMMAEWGVAGRGR